MQQPDNLTLHQAYKQVFSTENGCMVLKDIERACFKSKSVFRNDPYATAYNAGKQDVLKYIEHKMTTQPKEDKGDEE
jgi:hypothetical protein